jgi:hypothetical protein
MQSNEEIKIILKQFFCYLNNELNYIQSSGTSLMIITSRMSTTYNDTAQAKINPTKVTFSILSVFYDRWYSVDCQVLGSINNDALGHQHGFESRYYEIRLTKLSNH